MSRSDRRGPGLRAGSRGGVPFPGKEPFLWGFPLFLLLFFSGAGGLSSALGQGEAWGLPAPGGGKPFRFSSADATGANRDYRVLHRKEELVLCDAKGPGTITHIWMTVDPGRELPFSARKVIFRIYWEDQAEPAVEVPLGDFFGMGLGIRHNLWTLPVRVSAEGRAMNCFFPMPFLKEARLTLENQGEKDVLVYWNIDGTRGMAPGGACYFHAVYRQEVPALSAMEYEILEVKGSGRYLGTLFCIQQTTPGWPGEGNDRFYVDGDTLPTLEGTGLEDYFLDAWDFRPSNSPFYAIPLSTGEETGSVHTALRWHLADPVRFRRSLRVTVEKRGRVYDDKGVLRGNGLRKDHYSSVAFFYLDKPARPPGNPLPKVRRLVFPEVRPEARFLRGPLLEAEDAPDLTAQGSLRVLGANRLLWGGGRILEWTPSGKGAVLDVPMEDLRPGVYSCRVTLRRGRAGGRFQVSLPGGEALAFDAFLDKREELCLPERIYLGTFPVEGRRTVLEFKSLGRNAFSRGTKLEVDRIRLERKGDLPGRKEKAGRKAGGRGEGRKRKSLKGKNLPLPVAVVPFFRVPLKIDGVLEAAWKGAAREDLGVDTTGAPAPPGLATLVRVAADPVGLCLAFQCADKDVSTPYAKRDDPLWRADAVEVFLDPDGDGKDYVELEVSPKGVLFDASFQGPRRGENLSWNPAVEAGVKVDGTLDQPADKDRGWVVELRIPWKEIPGAGGKAPRPGAAWRANFFRVDRSKGSRGAGLSWAPVPEGDYHTLYRFGILRFGK